MPPCNCHPPFPRPEPFSPLPRPGKIPDWGKWIRDRLAEKGALFAFPSASAFPDPGAQPNVYEALDTGILYRWDGTHYQVLVDPSAANDVLEYEDRGRFPATGRSGAVYIDASANLLYRWDGTGYAPLTADLSGVESRLADVESKVPAQATAQNQLADKAFVNSSVATNTANYIYKTVDGRHVPFDSLAELQAYEGALTNNDYAFVVGADAAGNTTYTRYKWNGGTEAWAEEYVLNNSSFTAEQWAAISSGITSGLVAKLGALPTAEALAQALAGKLDTTEGVLNALGYVYSDWDMSAFPAAFQSSQPQTYYNEVINKYEWVILTGGVVNSDEKYDTEADALAALSITLRGPQLPNGAVATRTRTATSYRLGTAGGPNAGKPLQPAGDYALKASPATAGNLVQLTSDGGIVDSGVKPSDKLDASNGVATGLVTSLGTVNGFEYGLRFGTFGSDYAVQIVARSVGQSSWTATANLMVQKSKTGYAALLSDLPSVPSPATLTPYMDNLSGYVGNHTAYAREDHVHPSDGSKQNALSAVQLANIGSVSDAAEFSPSVMYAAGQAVAYNGAVYVFTASHGGAWTGTDVKKVNLLADKLDKSGGTMTGGLTMGGGNLITFSDSSGTRTMTIGINGDIFEIKLYSYGTLTYTWRTPYNGGIFALTSDLLTKLDSTSAAPAFSSDSSVSYPVGSHCTYQGKLYKCRTATTGGTWDASKWTVDTMTDPDAVLDITSQNQLRVVAKDGTVLWAQGYDLASTSSATLACDATNNFTFADGATTQAFTLPTAPTGKVGDFGLDINNSANTSAATMTLTGLDTAFSAIVPEGESLNDMLAIAAGELARFYITLSTFRVNNLPTWHIVKQVVENGGATA